MIGKIIGKVLSVEAFRSTYKVAAPRRAAAVTTQSTEEAIIASITALNKPRNPVGPQWHRRLANAYNRGEHGISRVGRVGSRISRYRVTGRLRERLPNFVE